MRIQWITGCILRRSIRGWGWGWGSGIDDRLPRRVTLSTSYICDRFYQFGGVPGGYDELSIDQLPGKLMITKTAEKNDRGKREGSCFSSYHSAKVQREGGFFLCVWKGFPTAVACGWGGRQPFMPACMLHSSDVSLTCWDGYPHSHGRGSQLA